MLKLLGGIFQSAVALVICSGFLVVESEGAPGLYSPPEISFNNYDQLATLLKEYLQFMEKVQTQPHITGQVSLRTPRSELIGDMANSQRLHQLQELDQMYGSKSRPRFGKRGWMNQDDVYFNAERNRR